MIGDIGLIGLLVALIIFIIKFNQLKKSGQVWYVLYVVLFWVFIILLAAPFGPVGLIVLGAVALNFDKLMDKHAEKFKAFLQRHKLPPFHKDDVKMSDPNKSE